MNDSEANLEGSQPLTGRQAALADIAERRRKNPNWNSKTDPTYVGPYPTFVELMSDVEFERYMAEKVERGIGKSVQGRISPLVLLVVRMRPRVPSPL